MAVAPNVQAGNEFETVIAEEAAFGTAITDAATFQRIFETEQSNFDLSGLVDADTPHFDGTNIAQEEDGFFTTAGGVIVKPFNLIATVGTIADYIYGVMQDIESEAVGTPFEKVLEWNDSTTRPAFYSDAGIFFTVVQKNPIANRDEIAVSCIPNTLTFTDDPGTNEGRLTLTGSWFSGFGSLYNKAGSQSIAGATEPDESYFHGCLKVTKQLGGVDMVMPSWNMALDNKAARVGCDSVGDAENYAVGVTKYAATGSIKVLYDANSKDQIDEFMTTSNTQQLVIAYGSGNDPVDTLGDLLFKFNVAVKQPQKDFSAVEGTMLDIPVICRGDGTNWPVEIQVADGIDKAWTA